jgi:outer membrane protein
MSEIAKRHFKDGKRSTIVPLFLPCALQAVASLLALAAYAQAVHEQQQSPSSAALAGPGSARDPASDPNALSLTMRDAVKLALKQNPGLLAARLEALESAQTAKIARAAFLPKATAGLEEQMQRLNLATLIGQESAPYSVGAYSNVQLDANFDIPLIAVSAWRTYESERLREKASGRDAAAVQESIAGVVVAQYLSLLRSNATEQAVQSRIDLATVLLRLANDQLRKGTGTSTDALRANVELLVEKENLVRAEAQTRGYGYGLAQVLGLSEDQQVVPAEILTAADGPVPEGKEVLDEAFETRPDLQSLSALRQAADYDRQAAEAHRLRNFWSVTESY